MRAFLVVLAACGTTQPDTPTGPQTITIGAHLAGVVTSTPHGISCGTCSIDPPSDCTSPPLPSTLCAADFEAGTTLTLDITDVGVNLNLICLSADDPSLKSCTFEVTRPITVRITGGAPLQ